MTEHDTEPDFDRLDLPTAARRLGISQPAIHKRIAKRQMRAEKVDGRWFVWIPRENSGSSPVNDQAINQLTQRSTEKDREISTLKELLSRRDDELARRDRELERRDREIERRDGEVHRVHVLLQQAQQVSLQLTDTSRKPWWSRFWRR